MRKALGLLVAVLLLVGLAATGVLAEGKVLNVWIMEPGNREAITRYFNDVNGDFEKSHPGVKVEIQYIPWMSGQQKFITSIAGGVAPDVAEMGTTWNPQFAEMGALDEMDKYVGQWGYRDDFAPALVESATLEGKLYGVPWYAGARGLMYRKDWFKEAGLEAPKTWEEFLQAAKVLTRDTDKDGKVDQYGFALQGNGQHTWQPLIWQNGGEIAVKKDGKWVSTLDQPAAVEALKWYVELLTKYKVAPEGSVTWNALNARQAFALGKAAMLIEGPWGLPAILKSNPDLEGKIGFALMPRGKKSGASFAGGSNLVVFKQSKNKELAADYVKFLIQPKNLIEWGKQINFFPGRLSTYDAYKDDPVLKAFAEQMKTARSYPATPAWGIIEKQALMTNMIQAMLSGKVGVEEGAKQAAAKMNEIFSY